MLITASCLGGALCYLASSLVFLIATLVLFGVTLVLFGAAAFILFDTILLASTTLAPSTVLLSILCGLASLIYLDTTSSVIEISNSDEL